MSVVGEETDVALIFSQQAALQPCRSERFLHEYLSIQARQKYYHSSMISSNQAKIRKHRSRTSVGYSLGSWGMMWSGQSTEGQIERSGGLPQAPGTKVIHSWCTEQPHKMLTFLLFRLLIVISHLGDSQCKKRLHPAIYYPTEPDPESQKKTKQI